MARDWTSASLLTAAVACVWLASPPCALASEVRLGNNEIVYTADQGEVNAVSIAVEGDQVALEDRGALIRVPAECQLSDDGHAAACPYRASDSVGVETNDMDDSVEARFPVERAAEGRVGGVRLEVHGGPGNDTLAGTGGVVLLWGDEGDDALTAGPAGNLLIRGEDGDDTGTAVGDGPATLMGGHGNDVLAASPEGPTNFIYGNAGDDTLTGGQVRYTGETPYSGSNEIVGGEGADAIVAPAGRNDLWGDGDDMYRHEDVSGGTRDSYYAPGGPDRIQAGVDAEFIVAGGGEDTITNADDADRLYCGPGRDSSPVGARGGDCEDSYGEWTCLADPTRDSWLELFTRSFSAPRTCERPIDPGGTFELPLRCPADRLATDCMGTLEVLPARTTANASASRAVLLARRSFRLRSGQSAAIRVRLRPPAARLVRRSGRRTITRATLRIRRSGLPARRLIRRLVLEARR